ncbi:kinase domain-containing protein [Salix suchowensis]|nr:kinase domain-containing protein [Salix suchowensis]
MTTGLSRDDGLRPYPNGWAAPPDEDSEGGMVIHLLDHFLTKDPALRITLAEVKRHPWFLREVQRPDKWLRDTSPHKIEVTSADTETAMTRVRFRWKWGSSLTRHISTLFRQVREAKPYTASHRGEVITPTRQGQPHGCVQDDGRCPRENPRDMPGPSKYTAPTGRVKGKKRADSHGDKSQRSKSVERSSSRKTAPKPSLLSASTVSKDGSSDANLVPQVGSSVGSSAQTSPTEGRPKSRFSIYSPSTWHWRSTKNLTTQSQSTSPGGSTPSRRQPSPHSTPQPSSMHSPDTCSPSSHSPVSPVSPDLTISSELLGRGIRRSEEALRGMQFEDISSSGPLTAARRASSWGDNPTEFNEVTSLNSEDHDLDESCILVGAGGVSNESPFRRTASVGLQLGSSPLAQIAYNISHEGYVYPDYEDDPIDDSSTFASARSVYEPVRSRGIAAIHANLGSQYDDFDDDEATTSEDHEAIFRSTQGGAHSRQTPRDFLRE